MKIYDFSWHEHGVYDAPAEISYVTKMTNQDIIYVGHSMGTTMFYVMAIEKPDIAARVKAMYSFAPIAYIYYLKSPLRLISPLASSLEVLISETLNFTYKHYNIFILIVYYVYAQLFNFFSYF